MGVDDGVELGGGVVVEVDPGVEAGAVVVAVPPSRPKIQVPIAQDASTIIKPTIASIIIFLALPVASSLPAPVRYWIPPIRSIIRKITPEMVIMVLKMRVTTFSTEAKPSGTADGRVALSAPVPVVVPSVPFMGIKSVSLALTFWLNKKIIPNTPIKIKSLFNIF